MSPVSYFPAYQPVLALFSSLLSSLGHQCYCSDMLPSLPPFPPLQATGPSLDPLLSLLLAYMSLRTPLPSASTAVFLPAGHGAGKEPTAPAPAAAAAAAAPAGETVGG